MRKPFSLMLLGAMFTFGTWDMMETLGATQWACLVPALLVGCFSVEILRALGWRHIDDKQSR
jgi:hypothetical protein